MYLCCLNSHFFSGHRCVKQDKKSGSGGCTTEEEKIASLSYPRCQNKM